MISLVSKIPPVPASVRAELARAQISGRQLGRHLGMTPAAIARRLSGRTPFTVDQLLQVAAFLEVPISRLLPDDAQRPRPRRPQSSVHSDDVDAEADVDAEDDRVRPRVGAA